MQVTHAFTRAFQGIMAGAWKFRLSLLACVFLISPVIIFDVFISIQRGRGVDKLVVFVLPASILWLAVCHSLFRRVWLTHFLLLPCYFLTLADFYLIWHYDSRLTSSLISVMLENAHHAGDFASLQGHALMTGLAICSLLFGLLLFMMRGLRLASRSILPASVLGLLLVYGAVLTYRAREHGSFSAGFLDVVAHDRNSPFGFIPQSYVALNVYWDALEQQRRSQSFTFNATRRNIVEGPEFYALVIGESSRRDHWSLFGYEKPTTPRLARTENLIPLTDMITQQALTQVSVPLMLTRRSINRSNERLDEKSIITAFKEAGFTTVWLSTQQRDQWSGAINRYSGEADQSRFLERRHDGVLLEAMANIIEEQSHTNPKLFFVLHTQGSHFVFRDRYPASSAAFPVTGDTRGKLIAEYDNSIEYTDRFLASAIEILQSRGATSALMYVSDHGENLYDDSRNLFGHMLNNEYDMPVPAFIWTSKPYSERFPAKINSGRRNASRALNTRVVFSTLADLAELNIADMDVQNLSIFNSQFEPQPRLFIKEGMVRDFDEWWLSTKRQSQLEE
ncbi:phosphoethanolamine transferase [Methylobacterium oxalidis]|uniref:phosphoethanolamine transferase n=1 Tax=Methylobacterium oxalidis TaxID=944322 RepID=UPI00331580E9